MPVSIVESELYATGVHRNELHCQNDRCASLILPNSRQKYIFTNSKFSFSFSAISAFQQITRDMTSLNHMHKKGPHYKHRPKKHILDGKPFAKGVVIRTLIKKPRKPNSANRKCVLLRLSTGKEMTAYVPGIGHNLQEHNTVLVRIARLRDTPGVKLKCIRGAYDLPHVIKRPQS